MAARCRCDNYSGLVRMDDCNFSLKRIKEPNMKEWITEANPLKEASTFERMEASRNSKNGQLQVMFWKKELGNLPLQKFDT